MKKDRLSSGQVQKKTEKRLIDIHELSEMIGYSTRTIYNWISNSNKDGEDHENTELEHKRQRRRRKIPFPYLREGGRIKFDIQDVEKWIQESKVEPRTEEDENDGIDDFVDSLLH